MMPQKPEVTFIIAHYNGADFLELCLQSIGRFSPFPHQVVIGDNGSSPVELAKVRQLLRPDDELLHIPLPDWHPSILEKLFRRADTRFVVTMDQDCLLLSEEWLKLFDDLRPEHRLLAGARDLCALRSSPQMVHVSFILLDKQRITNTLNGPLFYGEMPDYGSFQVCQQEYYHSLTCKALRYHPDSIVYLDPLQAPDYGYGNFWCRQDVPVAYHQWYSGRISPMADEDSLDGYRVEVLRTAKEHFISDYKSGRFKVPHI